MTRLNNLQQRYLELTNEILPKLAQHRRFPVQENHCFQRILLDNLFQCCWYEVLDRKQGAAYKQLTEAQLERAIVLAEAILTQPDEYIQQLNRNSLNWRKNSSFQQVVRPTTSTVN
jgi:hypothetical protein